ncbi:unnamed protein product [Prunus armeniaca]|uniref:Uncharacterized protein n=1 Tax=Prunus armeniaca TaxID=36596 RepID=A0A6J5UDB1_PRUAR|nr:unnamed protein product [Prunus armeniaca]
MHRSAKWPKAHSIWSQCWVRFAPIGNEALPLKSAVTFSSSKINASSLPEFTLYAHCLGKIVCVCLDSGTT